MDRLALMADKLDCAEWVYKVGRAIDRCDVDLFTSLFHPNAADDHGIFIGTAMSFIEWVIPLLAATRMTETGWKAK